MNNYQHSFNVRWNYNIECILQSTPTSHKNDYPNWLLLYAITPKIAHIKPPKMSVAR